MKGELSIPTLTHRLRARAESAGRPAPSYATVAAKVRDGVIPAVSRSGRWWIRCEDEPRIAELFGLPADHEPQRPAA